MSTILSTYRERLEARLSPMPGEFARYTPLTPAAVLIPIVPRREPSVLFTRRAEHLPAHAGQVSFPGGRVHQHDISAAATALRETEEEIGVGTAFVELAGFLDMYTTGTGFAIQPVVGFLRHGFELRPNAGEVAEIFEVPLSFLAQRGNYQRLTRQWHGSPRPYYALSFGVHTIWGATAGMLVNLSEKLADS